MKRVLSKEETLDRKIEAVRNATLTFSKRKKNLVNKTKVEELEEEETAGT